MTEDIGDISRELERARSALDLAQRRLQLTLDAAGASCGWEWDIVEKTLVADARFAAITHQDPVALADGVSTNHFFAAIHPDDLKRVKLAVAGILAGAETFSKEYRLLRSDGGYRWVHASGRAILDSDDRPVKFVGMLVDITDQKRASEELRIAQFAGGIGTFEYIVGYGTIAVSEKFCRLFGLHTTKVLPVRTLNDLIHPDDEPIIDLSNPDGVQNQSSTEFRVRRADDGEERWLARRGEYVDDIKTNGRRYMGVISTSPMPSTPRKDCARPTRPCRKSPAKACASATASGRIRATFWSSSARTACFATSIPPGPKSSGILPKM